MGPEGNSRGMRQPESPHVHFGGSNTTIPREDPIERENGGGQGKKERHFRRYGGEGGPAEGTQKHKIPKKQKMEKKFSLLTLQKQSKNQKISWLFLFLLPFFRIVFCELFSVILVMFLFWDPGKTVLCPKKSICVRKKVFVALKSNGLLLTIVLLWRPNEEGKNECRGSLVVEGDRVCWSLQQRWGGTVVHQDTRVPVHIG